VTPAGRGGSRALEDGDLAVGARRVPRRTPPILSTARRARTWRAPT